MNIDQQYMTDNYNTYRSNRLNRLIADVQWNLIEEWLRQPDVIADLGLLNIEDIKADPLRYSDLLEFLMSTNELEELA